MSHILVSINSRRARILFIIYCYLHKNMQLVVRTYERKNVLVHRTSHWPKCVCVNCVICVMRCVPTRHYTVMRSRFSMHSISNLNEFHCRPVAVPSTAATSIWLGQLLECECELRMRNRAKHLHTILLLYVWIWIIWFSADLKSDLLHEY